MQNHKSDKATREEPRVSMWDPMPAGYGFLKRGNPFMTGLCRRKTHAAQRTLYVVVHSRTKLGLRAPESILAEVRHEEQTTRLRREAEVARRDRELERSFEEAIQRLFPCAPAESVAQITQRAMKKRSGRVGRTGKLKLDDRARLAVVAHIRHCHTPYDVFLRGSSREAARERVHEQVSRLMGEWGRREPNLPGQRPGWPQGAAEGGPAAGANAAPMPADRQGLGYGARASSIRACSMSGDSRASRLSWCSTRATHGSASSRGACSDAGGRSGDQDDGSGGESSGSDPEWVEEEGSSGDDC